MAREDLGCILGDEMGLGKTLQIIALLEEQRLRGRGASLVIAPATLLENWRRELTKFAPELRVLIHIGSARTGNWRILESADVVVTSYDTGLADEPLLQKIGWNVVVFDEAQNIKSPDAQRTQFAKRLPRRVSIAVTGTPVENRLQDLWSLCDFSAPGLLGPLEGFTRCWSPCAQSQGSGCPRPSSGSGARWPAP